MSHARPRQNAKKFSIFNFFWKKNLGFEKKSNLGVPKKSEKIPDFLKTKSEKNPDFLKKIEKNLGFEKKSDLGVQKKKIKKILNFKGISFVPSKVKGFAKVFEILSHQILSHQILFHQIL